MPKFSQYSQLVGQPASDDRLLLRDVSDPSMAATGTTKEVSVSDLLLGAVDGKIVPLLVPIKNASNTTAIAKGTLLMATGATGDKVLAAPAVTNGSVSGIYIIGVSGEAIAPEAEGFAYSYTEITNFDTSAWPVGTVLWNNPAVAGGLSTTEPTAPNLKVSVAIVTRQQQSSGRLFVRETVSPRLKELSDVHAPSPSDGQALVWNNANSRWEPTSLSSGSVKATISQNNHGFSAGSVVRFNGSQWVAAQASTEANSRALGIVESVTQNAFVLVMQGQITGLSGLNAGSLYYLSANNPGALTTTAPTGNSVVKPILLALSATTGIIANWLGRQGSATDAGEVTVSALEVDWNAGNFFTKTISASSTFDFTNNANGRSIVLTVRNSGGSPVTVNFSSSVSFKTTPVSIEPAKASVFTFIQTGGSILGVATENFTV